MNPAVVSLDQDLRVHAKPVLRWAGGKRWLVPIISDLVYTYLTKTGGRYIEPFAGGAAVALDLGLNDMVVADLCEPLITCYRLSRDVPDQVLTALERYKEQGTDKETYYRIRAARPIEPVQRAAWLFYMNALCFNGVYRENSKGTFNVPYGVRAKSKKLPGSHPFVSHSFITAPRLAAFGDATADTTFVHSDFAPVIDQAVEGDFVFADSPYYGVFDKYLKEGFGVEQHVALARSLQAAQARGVAFIATNNDVPEVRNLYRWAHVVSTGEYRRVNRNANNRGKVGCVLVASSRDLVPASVHH